MSENTPNTLPTQQAVQSTDQNTETSSEKARSSQVVSSSSVVARSKKKRRVVTRGKAQVHATYNNTIFTITDLAGNVIAWSSSGRVGFTGPKKSTPYAAGVVVRNAIEKAKEYGLKDVIVEVKGIGTGRDAAVRAIAAQGLNIMSIRDVTPVPHNGCKRPKPRRV